jgi:ABC-type transport system involved in multi-copper enzyme maturation permease subunit
VLTVSMSNSVSVDNGVGAPVTLLDVLGEGALISVLAIWMVYLLSSTLTIVFTANMISGEVEAGTFALLVPKPVTRAEIVAGKWAGSALLVCSYTALMVLAFLTVIRWQTGYWPTGSFAALGLLEMGMLVLLGITTLGSTLFPTMVNGAIALLLFLGAPMVSLAQFVVQLLQPTSSQTVQSITTVTNLVIPTDALWHGAAFFLLPPTANFLTLAAPGQNFNSPFTSGQPIAPALLIWAILYGLVLPVLAALRFQRRDL